MCIPRRMMFLFVRKRMNSLNEVAGIIFFLLHWYWDPRASVYLLFCYFLCAPQTERKKYKEVDNRMTIQSSGNLNLHLNGIKKGKLKRIRTLANEYNKNQNSHIMCVCVLYGDDHSMKNNEKNSRSRTHRPSIQIQSAMCLGICAVTAIACRDMFLLLSFSRIFVFYSHLLLRISFSAKYHRKEWKEDPMEQILRPSKRFCVQ